MVILYIYIKKKLKADNSHQSTKNARRLIRLRLDQKSQNWDTIIRSTTSETHHDNIERSLSQPRTRCSRCSFDLTYLHIMQILVDIRYIRTTQLRIIRFGINLNLHIRPHLLQRWHQCLLGLGLTFLLLHLRLQTWIHRNDNIWQMRKLP